MTQFWWVWLLTGALGCSDTGGPARVGTGGGRGSGGVGTWAGALSGTTPARGIAVDTAAHVFEVVANADLTRSPSLLLPIDEQQALAIEVDRFSIEPGYFALKGHVEGPPSAIAMLKGTREQISGWIASRAEDSAYRYSTESGSVVVERVSFKQICPSCDHPMPRRADVLNDPQTPRVLHAPTELPAWRAEEPHIGAYTGADLLTLESRPSASKVLFMDIAPVLDASGTPKDFSKEEMWMAWQSVAAAFSPFEVNVTTKAAVYDATPARDRGKANFTSSNDVAFCYEEVFGTTWDCEIYTGPGAEDSLGYGVGRTTAHEFGHMMGLLDVGTSTSDYFEGFDEYKWYPKMGNYYYGYDETNSLFQWSKGEYAGAIDTEDSLATISSTLPYRDDDIPDTRALDITGSSEVSSDTNRGIIERTTDTDRFTFEIGPSGGQATLTIDRIEYTGGAMLDVQATLLDGGGATLATGNLTAKRSASISATLAQGTYTLVIEGGAEGTPSRGFSKYGSLGYYGIDGTITGAIGNGTGGAEGTGGATATGGSAGTAGAAPTGGSPQTGGDSSSGGSVQTGGRSGRGGSAGMGGRSGTGGSDSDATGGLATGGTGATGGTSTGAGGVSTGGGDSAPTGGAVVATGGSTVGAGGMVGGGAPATGGGTTLGTGGVPATGGASSSGTGGGSTPVNCQPPQAECNQACVDLSTDPAHCGQCGHACAVGESCAGGQCMTPDDDAAEPNQAATHTKDSGCACSAGGRDAAGGWLALALGTLVVARRRTRRLPGPLLTVLFALCGLYGCGSEGGDEANESANEETGGLDHGDSTGGTTPGAGGSSSFGGTTGGQTSAPTGGSTNGTATGGTATGGTATGGTATGGTATGGTTTAAGATGATATGGSATGGVATGGVPSGGRGGATSTGGRSVGGSSTGGVATGGSSATGGAENTGGSAGCYTGPAQEIGTQAPSATVRGYGTVMIWANAPRQIAWLQTTLVVPPKPPASGTLFLWPGIQPDGDNFEPIDNGVLQPVLTWGPACAPGNQPRAYSTWWISGQYVNTNGDYPGYTGCLSGPIMSVNVCDTLNIDIALSGTVWTQTVADEQTNETVTYDLDMQNQSQNLVYFVIEEYSSTPVSEVIFTDTTIAFDSPDAADCRVYMRGTTDYVSTPVPSSDGLQCSIQQIILRAQGIDGG
jgi:MYXO-CTERM domain-containing protein